MKINTPYATRRQFLKKTGLGLAAAPFLALPLSSCAATDLTIGQVMELIMAEIPGDRNPNTVDTVKIGDPSWTVKGIATTFLATVPVIEKAAVQGINFIITHEPTFYNHLDETGWLENDPVYAHKKALLEKHQIVVWRFHDYWHQYRPDGILQGFLERMNWQNARHASLENAVSLPPQSLKGLAESLQTSFKLNRTFYIGNPKLQATNVGILLGAWGREKQIKLLQQDIEVLIVGEVSEWETSEYVRDASAAGLEKGLIILGHAESEEPGMAWCADWVQALLPNVLVEHLPAGDAFVKV